MKQTFVRIIIVLLYYFVVVIAYQYGNYIAERSWSDIESLKVLKLKRRIFELEELEKRRTSSDTNSEKPPKNE